MDHVCAPFNIWYVASSQGILGASVESNMQQHPVPENHKFPVNLNCQQIEIL